MIFQWHCNRDETCKVINAVRICTHESVALSGLSNKSQDGDKWCVSKLNTIGLLREQQSCRFLLAVKSTWTTRNYHCIGSCVISSSWSMPFYTYIYINPCGDTQSFIKGELRLIINNAQVIAIGVSYDTLWLEYINIIYIYTYQILYKFSFAQLGIGLHVN